MGRLPPVRAGIGEGGPQSLAGVQVGMITSISAGG